MNRETFKKKVVRRGLTPLEVVVSPDDEVRWFVCKDEDNIVLFDAKGFAYTAKASGDSTMFVFDASWPKYKGKMMKIDGHYTL